MAPRLAHFMILLLGLLVASASAEPPDQPDAAPPLDSGIHLAFPLHGYFHPGRYMPLRIKIDLPQLPPHTILSLNAQGAMTTEIPLTERQMDIIAPWLACDEFAKGPQPVLISAEKEAPGHVGILLRPLTARQHLVGYASGDASSAAALSRAIIRIPSAAMNEPPQRPEPISDTITIALDPATPLPGPISAWSTLDLIVLDHARVAASLDETKIAALVAAGVAIAVRNDGQSVPPFNRWPWRRTSSGGQMYWVLSAPPAGRSTLYDDVVYRPVDSWKVGWPPGFHKRILLMAMLYSIAAMAIVLLRARASSARNSSAWITVFWLGLLTAGATALMGYWWHLQTPAMACAGDVMIVSSSPEGSLVRIDSWEYEASATRADIDVSWADITQPIFSSRRQLMLTQPILRCASNGDPNYFHLRLHPRPEEPVALLSRIAGPQAPHAIPSNPVNSPLRVLVQALYLKPGDQLLGQIESPPSLAAPYQSLEQWPAIVVRSAPPPQMIPVQLPSTIPSAPANTPPSGD